MSATLRTGLLAAGIVGTLFAGLGGFGLTLAVLLTVKPTTVGLPAVHRVTTPPPVRPPVVARDRYEDDDSDFVPGFENVEDTWSRIGRASSRAHR